MSICRAADYKANEFYRIQLIQKPASFNQDHMSFETCAKLIKPFEMAIMSGSDNVRQISSVCSTTSGEAYGNHKKYIQDLKSF